jgi:Histidine kinase-like ATPase domain
MATTATQADPRLIALALRSCPESVPVARRQVRAALSMHGLGEYADDAEIITSELVTNAVQHACAHGTKTIRVSLTHTGESGSGDRRRVGFLPARPHQARHPAWQRAGPRAADR